MSVNNEPAFGDLLKRFRRLAHLTQADLAERAGYSFHYVSMLERGVRFPLPLTVDLLADALELREADRVILHAATNHGAHSAVREVPTPLRSLVGREDEKKAVIALLRHDHVRILTVTGPGGVGKTRLAEHVAGDLARVFFDGMAFVDLAVVGDPDGVVPAILRVLKLKEVPDQTALELIIDFLREREMLLFLDSFERVREAALDIGRLVSECPRVKVLTTSRAPLHLSTEQEFPLQPLALPDPAEVEPGELMTFAAVELFIQRARLTRPLYMFDSAEMAIVADVCRRLDGLPLAIELAAAQLAHLPLSTLRSRLDNRLQILTGGASDLPTRQQRMRDTIAWSYAVLSPTDQSLFRRLSMFAGSWSLEAAETLCAADDPADTVLDGLRSLVTTSLVVPIESVEDEPRYRMLDTIHEYAAEQLAADPGAGAARRRHAEYYIDLAERAEPALQGRDQGAWYPLLEREHDNLRAALEWLLQVGEVEGALRLAGAVWRFWQRHGDFREGRRWLEEGLARGEGVAPPVRNKALWGASWLAYHQGDYARTRVLSAAHLEIARQHGDAIDIRNALTGLGIAAMAEGRYADALPLLQEGLDICRSLRKTWHLATSYLNLGVATMHLGDYTRASCLFGEALALYRERGDDLFSAQAVEYLGYIALLQGDHGRATTLFKSSLEAFVIARERTSIADALASLAAFCAITGEVKQAARLGGAAAGLRASIGGSPLAFHRTVWEPYIKEAAEQLTEAEWQTAWNEGRAMSIEQAVAAAMQVNGEEP